MWRMATVLNETNVQMITPSSSYSSEVIICFRWDLDEQVVGGAMLMETTEGGNAKQPWSPD